MKSEGIRGGQISGDRKRGKKQIKKTGNDMLRGQRGQ